MIEAKEGERNRIGLISLHNYKIISINFSVKNETVESVVV